jgi:hypothetical protein
MEHFLWLLFSVVQYWQFTVIFSWFFAKRDPKPNFLKFWIPEPKTESVVKKKLEIRKPEPNSFTAMSQLWLYEYMFQMWTIDPYALCIRTFSHIWNMYSYNRIWEIAVFIVGFHLWKFTQSFQRFWQKRKSPSFSSHFQWFLLILSFEIFQKSLKYCRLL